MKKADATLGKTVKLASGGPVMTIVGSGKGGFIICNWFAGDLLQNGRFPAEVLQETTVPVPQP
jgi:uncharacterized protein YodC (DUF2158 family)